ncbi:MAG: hypothetical protein LBI82_08105 [Dysgonamonadaceae bacterium]|jgi:hypothetical protein|nr:hypothetical protein [Dysgonamonadaceae bacterium]
MKKYLNTITVFILLMSACNIDYKGQMGVSKDIQESKERNVFIKEYQIKNIHSFNDSLTFPIEKAWLERCWRFALDESGKEISVVDTSCCCYQIAFELTKRSKKDFFQTDSYLSEWIIEKDSLQTPGGIIHHGVSRIFIDHKDSVDRIIPMTIYKQESPVDFKNNITSLFKFDLITKSKI